jgi:hypothetical protein
MKNLRFAPFGYVLNMDTETTDFNVGNDMSGTDSKADDSETPFSNPSLESSEAPPSIPPIPTSTIPPLLSRAILETPFTIPVPLDNAMQSMKTLTAKLLLARQNGRLFNYHSLWTVIPIALPADSLLPTLLQVTPSHSQAKGL